MPSLAPVEYEQLRKWPLATLSKRNLRNPAYTTLAPAVIELPGTCAIISRPESRGQMPTPCEESHDVCLRRMPGRSTHPEFGRCEHNAFDKQSDSRRWIQIRMRPDIGWGGVLFHPHYRCRPGDSRGHSIQRQSTGWPTPPYHLK
jgi:hypothetical protein